MYARCWLMIKWTPDVFIMVINLINFMLFYY